jgi:hypothetical protein
MPARGGLAGGRGSGGEARGGRRAPAGGHGLSQGGPRRWGHAEQRLTGDRAGGTGPPAALARSERACGVEYNEAEAAVHAAVAVTAQSCGKRRQ